MARTYQDLLPVADRLARLFYREEAEGAGMDQLAGILQAHPRLMIIMNHGPVLGPAPGLAALVRTMVRHGGGDRVPFGVTWRGFYRVPGVALLAERLVQTSADSGVEDVVARLCDGTFNDCGIMPEGEYSNVGNGIDIQPFRSQRFIEAAVRAEVPVLLLAHSGTEKLGRPVPIPAAARFLVARLPEHLRRAVNQSGVVSLPWLLGGRIPRLGLACELYQPDLSPGDLEEPGSAQQVTMNARHVRARLQRLVNHLVLEFGED
ncbi:MAG: hypothetical protein ACQEQ1_01505 [Pseudomonadota bacterium]